MQLPSNLAPWNGTFYNDSTGGGEYPPFFNLQYRRRNAVIGALGIVLNMLVLPVICSHDDLSLYLKATFCCMAAGDFMSMGTTLTAGFLPEHLSPSEIAGTMRTLTCSIYLAGNVNCMVMVAIAVERMLALYRPELFRRLGKSKVKVVLVQLNLLGSGCLLTLPVLLSTKNKRLRYTPMANLSGTAIAVEAGVMILSSLTVCAVYTGLACILLRRTSPRPPLPPASSAGDVATSSTRSSGGLQPATANGVSASESASGTLSNEYGTTLHIHISSRQMRRFRRATVHSAVLAVWFFLAYAPFGFYYLWVLLSRTDRQAESKTVRITIISSFPLANSLVDPVVLLWRLFPLSNVGNLLQDVAVQATAQVHVLYHHARQRLSRAWTSLRSLWRRRRNRVGNLGADPQPSPTKRNEGLRTIVVDGPSCSTRVIQVQEAPSRKKVRVKSTFNSSDPGRRISGITEQTEDTAA